MSEGPSRAPRLAVRYRCDGGVRARAAGPTEPGAGAHPRDARWCVHRRRGLLAVLLAAGIEAPGLQRLVGGFGFSTGFFFVVRSEAVLFTEANVVLPATLLETRRSGRRIARFWAIGWIGNLVGAIVTAHLIAAA